MNHDKAVVHVGMLLFELRDIVDQLIDWRRHRYGALLDGEEAEIAAVLLNLQILLSDIKESRSVNKCVKLHLVSNR